MKQTFFFLLLLFTCTVFGQQSDYASSSNPYYWKNRKPFDGYWQQDVDYTIKASLNDSSDIVSATEELIYTNQSPDTLYQVYFHLYQNAFIKGSYLEQLNLANDFKQRFGRHEGAGNGTRILELSADAGGAHAAITLSEDQAVMSRVNGKPFIDIDYSIMRVQLPAALLPGEKAVFRIRFMTYFDDGGNQRRRMKMFRDEWGNKQYDGVHWYPRIAVYDRKFGWETDQHLGKEFYGDFGTYSVELDLPSHYVLDATGVLLNKDEVLPDALRKQLDIANFKDKPLNSAPSVIIANDGSRKTWKFRSINTHDFAWVADPTFRIGESLVKLSDGTTVSCIALAQEPHASRWQDAAPFTSKVIETYSKDIGIYAYPKMIVADARDGMEYPMLTLDGGLSPGYYSLFAHEVGHNWFFGMVGNNETYRAALDEGFTQFLTNWCMTRLFGEVQPSKKNPYPITRREQTIYNGYIRDAIRNEDMPLNTHSDDFNGALNHGGGYGHVYYKTATMLYNLQYVLGDTLFLAAMQHYFNQWKMAHPYMEDFRNSIIQFTHVDLNWFFDQWMETTKSIDYGVTGFRRAGRTSTSGGQTMDNYKLQLERFGEMQMPLDITVYGKDSKERYSFHIPNTWFVKSLPAETQVLPVWRGWGVLNTSYAAEVSLPSGISVRNVIIDPSYRLADVDLRNNATQSPTYWVFDKGKKRPADRRYQAREWRPDIWYNSIDGAKVGVHYESGYQHIKDVVRASVWLNTDRFVNSKGTSDRYVDFIFAYRNTLRHDLQHYFDFRSVDGLEYAKVGLVIPVGKSQLDIFVKSMERPYASDVKYLLYQLNWKPQMYNTTFNIEWVRAYSRSGRSGEFSESFRTSIVGSDRSYAYSRFSLQWIHHQMIARTELHSRVFAQVMAGSRIAPESKLMLGGANAEEMMENKYTRSRGFVPDQWTGYGVDYNHFQAAGGLNIRGYAGYLIPRTSGTQQVYMYGGNNGGAVNLEYDLDGLVKLTPSFTQWLHVDAYLFGDAGILENQFKSGEYGLTQDATLNTGMMVSAGAGCAFTIRKWWQFDKARPLTIRFDMPLLLTNSPYVDGAYFRYRWQLGLNRSF